MVQSHLIFSYIIIKRFNKILLSGASWLNSRLRIENRGDGWFRAPPTPWRFTISYVPLLVLASPFKVVASSSSSRPSLVAKGYYSKWHTHIRDHFIPLTYVVLNIAITAVDFWPVWVTDSQEVRPQTAYSILSDVSQGLTSWDSEQKGSDGFVNGGYVGIADKGIRMQDIKVNRQRFSNTHLKKREKRAVKTASRHFKQTNKQKCIYINQLLSCKWSFTNFPL